MTLIASFQGKEIPVLIGDVIVSTPLQGERTFFSPAAGTIEMSPLVPEAHGPSALCQKIVPLSKNLWFAWSGPLLGAMEIAYGLQSKFGDAFAEGDEVIQAVTSIQYGLAMDTSIVGMCRSARGIHSFGIRCKERKDGPWGPVRAAGSGFPFFRAQLEGAEEITNSESPVGLALALAGSQVCLEIYEGMTLRNHFGGYCEIAFLERERFVKLTDVTYIFWKLSKIERKVSFHLHPVVLNASYHNEWLVISRIDNVTIDTEAPRKTARSMICVPPLLRLPEPDPLSISPPSLDSGWKVHTFLNIDKSRKRDIFTNVYAAHGTESARFADEEDAVRLSITDRLRARFNSTAIQYLSAK